MADDFKSRFDELMAKANAEGRRKPRKHKGDEEHQLQVGCVNWFRLQYPKMHHNLFAVPNGSMRDVIIGAKLKAEGVLPGVSDLILLKPNSKYGALLIEMKMAKGKQSEKQVEWQGLIEQDGYKYVVCRSITDFMREVKKYLKE